MMENCEEARLDTSRRRGLAEVGEVGMQETTELLSCEKFEPNRSFGAEIVNINITSQQKIGKSTMATTEHDKTSSESSAWNLADLPINAAGQPDQIAKHDSNSNEEDIDDADSYQSDDMEQDQSQDNSGRELNTASQDSDESSSDSDFSDLSGLSDVSGREWKPINTQPINWVQKQMHSGANPRELLSQMLPSGVHQIANGLTDMTLWRILASMLSEPPRRQKLRYINTFDDVTRLVLQSKNIIVLTGAGVSVSCGIPDFRSSDGIYSRLAKDYPDLPDPQAMFDINYFSRDPRPFYKFAREIYPGQFKPSPCHRFIKLLEKKQKLLRNYTQNIDTLEQVAGIQNVIECHGSFSTASCTKCKLKCNADAIRPDVFAQRIPVCPRCQPNVQQSVDASEPVSEENLKRLVENGIMKPDIVFFGEGLPEEFHTVMASDKDKCDLLIVMGSSLKVRPVALIPSSIPANVPQILINREQLHHLEFDVELLGDSDVIINQLCHCLGGDWLDICFDEQVLKESKELLPLDEDGVSTEGEEDIQQLHDADTQSIKSNASADIALRSAGTYSDSGFESSTSSAVAISEKANEAIEKIKTSILEFDNTLTKNKSVSLVPSDLLDDHMNAVDFRNPGFSTYSEHTTARPVDVVGAHSETYRHLSIDSSKDSGIQCCESSNSALTSNGAIAKQPTSTNFVHSGCTRASCTKVLPAWQASTATAKETGIKDTNTTVSNLSNAERSLLKHRQLNSQSAAERLQPDTYYYHESSASYVFPGAQVSWCSDSEDDDVDGEQTFNAEAETDTSTAPFSPLLPPSVEAEMVSDIATTTKNAFSICSKRQATNEDEHTTATLAPTEVPCSRSTIHLSNTAIDNMCPADTDTAVDARSSPPLTKRARISSLEDLVEGEAAATSNNSSNSGGGSGSVVAADSVAATVSTTAPTEALLQQL